MLKFPPAAISFIAPVPIVIRSVPAVSNLITSSSELSSTCILVSPSASVIELDEPPPETVAKLKLPEPSVCSTWFALPSAAGNVYALLKVIVPSPLIANLCVPEVEPIVAPVLTSKLPLTLNMALVLVESLNNNLEDTEALLVSWFINIPCTPAVVTSNLVSGDVVPIPTLLLSSITRPTPEPPPAAKPKKSLAPALNCTPTSPVAGDVSNFTSKVLVPFSKLSNPLGELVPIPTLLEKYALPPSLIINLVLTLASATINKLPASESCPNNAP